MQLSVKKILACEQLSFYAQAYNCLSDKNENSAALKNQLFFLKLKLLEAKGTEPSCHVSVVYCSLAAEELLVESKKAYLTFCLADPITRCTYIHTCVYKTDILQLRDKVQAVRKARSF